VTTYSADLDRFSAGVAIGLLQRVVAHNVKYLDGGWTTLVTGLRQAAVEAGADIITGERAVGIDIEDGVARRLQLASGLASPQDAVIVATSPTAASALVPSSATLARHARESVPATAACLDIALSRLPAPKNRFALGIDRPLYYSVHSFAARIAPAGGAVIHAAIYREHGSTEAHDAMEAELEATVELLQPGWRELVVERRFLPKLVVSNAIPTADTGGYLGRPDEAVPEVQGVFVAGDWVGREGCLSDAALGSAKAAVRAATEGAKSLRRRRHTEAALA
jgi:phytoene dehydrogenase-like protein